MKYLLSSFCVLVTLSVMVDAASAEGTVWRVDCSYTDPKDSPPANVITGDYVEPAAANASAAFGASGVQDYWNTWNMDTRDNVTLGGWSFFNGVLTSDSDLMVSTLTSTDGGRSVTIGSTANNNQHQPRYGNGTGSNFEILTGNDTSAGTGDGMAAYTLVISGLTPGRTLLFYSYAWRDGNPNYYTIQLNSGSPTTVNGSSYSEGSAASGVLLSTVIGGSGSVTCSYVHAGFTGPGFQFAELPPAPEINVKGNGNSITNGDVTPSGSDNTDFSQLVVGSSVTNTFTIENTGNAPLTVTNVTVGGDFSVVVQPSNTVSGGGSTTFMVSFTPQGLGAQTQTLSIANSDSDEGNYTFWLSGAGVAVPTPEIDITGTNGASIACGAAASVASGTDFGSVSGSRTFTITNTGLASLSITGTPSVVISGAGAEQFTVTSFPSDSVASHGATTFTVQFTATGAAGVKTATVSIGNSDSSGGEDPYTFSLAGLVPPVIKVWRVDCSHAGQSDVPPVNIITGDYVEPAAASANAAFGSAGVSDLWNTWDMDARSGVLGGWAWFNGVLTADADSAQSTLWSTDGGTAVKIGSIANNGQHQPWSGNGSGSPFAILTGSSSSSGNNDHSVGSTYTFVISGLNAGRTLLFYDYALNAPPGSGLGYYRVALNGGAATTINCSSYTEGSAASGALLSTVVQVSGCVTVKLTSAGLTGPGFQFAELPPAPEINVKGNGNSVTNGDVTPSGSDNTDFSQLVVGSSVTNTFTIENTGNAPLAVTNVTVGGDFSVVVQPSNTVSGGGSTTFMVSFTPQGLGAQTQTLSIANSDSDEGNYTFWLSGAGVAVPTPEIDITGTNGASIACGAAASVASGTDFGSVSGSRTFTITNTGLASLSLTSTPSVVISGAGAEQFTVTSFPSDSVASHGATTFTVQFTATGAAGVKGATVSIGNNDSSGGEDPYTFSLAGLVPPVIKVWRVDCSYAGQNDVPPVNIITGDYVEPAAASANAAFGSAGVSDLWNTWDMDARSGVLGGWAWFNGVLTADADSAHSTLWSTDGGTSVLIGSTANNGQHQPWTGNGSGTPFDILTGSETSSGLNGADPASTYSFVISGLTAGRRFLFYDYAHRVGPRVDILPAYKVSLDGGPGTTNYHTLYSEGDAASGVLLSTVIGGAGTVTITLTAAGFTGPGFQFAELPPAPEINVTGNGSSITNGDITPSGGDGTDFGQTLSGGSVTNSFTIESDGNLLLAVSNVSVVGSSDFSVATQPSNSVSEGSSAAFDIVFTPTGGIGLKTGTVSIANNDADENPYTFNVEGELVSVFTPEIDIRGTNGASIASGSSASVASGTDFGTATLSHTFTITNTGLASLTLTGTPSVVISGAGASQFTVTTFPSNSVPSHGSTTFTVQFSASGAAGIKEAVISIGNNDTSGGEDPYTFGLTGTVLPSLKVWRVDCSYGNRSDVPPANIITGDYVEPAAAAANAAFGSSGVHDYWNTWDMDARLDQGGRLGGWAWFNGVLTADSDPAHSTLLSTDGGASVLIGSPANNGQHQVGYGNGTGTSFDILTGDNTSSGMNGDDPLSSYTFVISGLRSGWTFLFYDYAQNSASPGGLGYYKVSLDGGAETQVNCSSYSEGDPESGVLVSTVIGESGSVTVTLTAAGFTGPGFQFTQVSPAPPRGVLLLIR